ncbi:MAG: LicD family protein [bacterium]|nr:LicD family protein [bacterium]
MIKKQILNFISKIFSIQNYGETHNLVYILGLKIKFPKSKFRKLLKENPYNKYVKNNVDITTIPPATGQIRDIQLANLALLDELDYVCKQNNLDYWLNYGSLIGAVRHKGFIPWDDDIDVGMLRDDYNKIIEAFEKYSRNSDIYADFYRDEKVQGQYIIKVQHKKCSLLFVDIFPSDIYGKKMTETEQLEKTKQIKNIVVNLKKTMNSKMTNSEVKDLIDKTMKEVIQNTPENIEEADFIWGLDFYHRWKNWFANYDTIFPLQNIDFEGRLYKTVNKTDKYLKNIYGDYMTYPKKIGVGHSMYLNLSKQDEEIIKSLANKKD